MSEAEKLIKLLDNFHYDLEEYMDNNAAIIVDNHIDLAEYLTANGVVVLPYKVGDKIYYIDEGKVEEDTIKFITITKDGCKPILTWHNRKFWDYYKFGVDVFLTKKEAEAKLKTMEV